MSVLSAVPSRPRLRIGLMSTYPPTVCGLATFSSALEHELKYLGHEVDFVRVDDGSVDRDGDPSVAAVLRPGSRHSIRQAAAVLSGCDVAIVQHEYGIYGGADGEEVLEVLKALVVPSVVVLHTVPAQPSEHQAALLIEICDVASTVVVMTESARERLTGTYFPIDESKVVTIPHGALVASVSKAPATTYRNPRGQLLTWGLLGPGKGVEHAIDAVALLQRRGMPVRYTVAGVTHPKVRAREGDCYRNSLIERAHNNGVGGYVTFDDVYRGVMRMTHFVASSSVVVLPYDSYDQVTSGVLVDSIAAGRPVIATAFPHAVELLSSGAGIVVPHRDPTALADAIHTLTTDAEVLRQMTIEARRLAPSLSWYTVAKSYARECQAVAAVHQQVWV
jgi:polysaccharide biosynthesis protein PslF